MKLFNLTLKLNGFPVDETKKVYDEILKVSESDYAAFTEKRKKEIVEFHLKNNVFYKDLVGKDSFKKWEELPVLTKKNLQQPIENRLSKGYNIKNVFVNKTSGSSGDPFVFAKDKRAHAITWNSIINKFGWFDIDFNTDKQARFYGIPLDKKGYYKERIKDFFSNRYRFPIFNLDDAFLAKVLKKFESTAFDYINGYTSSVVLFAKYLKSQNVVLKDVCPSLKTCFVTSEMLFEDDKHLMEQYFGVQVINEYGASELDLIAFENPEGKFALNTETLFIEILDSNNKPVENGKEGKIVITSLYNKAHPFIRYEIGDVGIIDETSNAKTSYLKKLTGRTSDIAKLPSGKIVPGLTFYYVTKSVIKDDGNVKEFIVKQTKLDTFEIEYVADNKLNNKEEEAIIQAGNAYLEPNLHYIFAKKDVLTRTSRGKLKQFQSLIN
ncbi:phenylacetate--CoA ligase family protein [Flavobacterium agricola]|uniref:Phenylacetate--CoA ligase family protein n=1 Tax=Flavobacterium agricola TaxID=2870839 RepID=A0ABY6LX97_9FLAO|nr:phenylacetate--CoA ligase family protein [Flavobacterium agricola]UYW00911.1 phenylacetate--CoA ligase family protein [Flavobacterium agricola]